MLEELVAIRGCPKYLRSDNGPEFAAKAVRKWLRRLGVGTLIEPGSPWENGKAWNWVGTQVSKARSWLRGLFDKSFDSDAAYAEADAWLERENQKVDQRGDRRVHLITVRRNTQERSRDYARV